MKVWHGLADVARDTGPYAVTIGTFDGVHLGHRAVIGRTIECAAELALPTCLVTIHPHPLAVLRPAAAPLALTTLERRLTLLADVGVDAALVLPFDRDVSHLTPEEFVARYLVAALQAHAVVVGPDFRFGYRAAGDVNLLRALGTGASFRVAVLDRIGDAGAYSSTRIRQLIADGDVTEAWAALGRPHLVEGPVIEGDKRGRTLGYPTANLAVPAGIAVPPDGVYAGWLVRADGTRLPAAISVGTNPTFGAHPRRVEAYVLDRDDLELYGEHVVVEFGWHLRGMVTFDGIDPLLVQMAADCEQTRELTSTHAPAGGVPARHGGEA